MTFRYNDDENRRNEILRIPEISNLKRVPYVSVSINIEQMEMLIKEGFINPKSKVEDPPTFEEVLDYMKRTSGINAEVWVRLDLKKAIAGNKLNISMGTRPVDPLEEFEYNTNTKRREEILGISSDAWEKEKSDIIEFVCNAEQLEFLIKEKFVDPNESTGTSPTFGEMLEFMKKYPKVIAKGCVRRPPYVTSTIEGRKYITESDTFLVQLCRGAGQAKMVRTGYARIDR